MRAFFSSDIQLIRVMFFISSKIRENVHQIQATRIKANNMRKITNFEFIRGKNKSLTEILKVKHPKIDPCGMSLTRSLQSLNVELILILFVRFLR